MIFWYEGNIRTTAWFDSPNHWATFLVMLLMVFIGLSTAIYNYYISWKRTLAISFIGLSLLFIIVELIQTYSRGGWLACLSGFGLLFASLKQKYLSTAGLALLILIVCIMIFPDAHKRINYDYTSHDNSVLNRLEVWRGALAMTAYYGWNGAGDDNFGKEFDAWFQPIKMKTSYRTAINNYLTLSSENGIVIFGIYLIIVLMPLWLSWKLAVKAQNFPILGMCAAMLAYLISGCFTYSINVYDVSSWFWLLIGITTAYIVLCCYKNKISLRFVVRDAVPSLLFSLLACILIYGSGMYVLAKMPTRHIFFRFDGTGHGLSSVIIYPTKQVPRGVVIWSHGKGDSIRDDGKNTLRYMAEKGFIMIAMDYRGSEMDALEDIRSLTKWVLAQKQFEEQPIFLAGFSLGARLSILTACHDPNPRIRAVASIGAVSEWPFEIISPVEHLYNLGTPLLIVHGEIDKINIVENAYKLESLCKHYHKSYDIYIVHGGSHALDEDDHWFVALDRISNFLLRSSERIQRGGITDVGIRCFGLTR